MTYNLILGDYAYSSWSLRGWLLFENFGLSARTRMLDFNAGKSVAEQLAAHAPARTVPVMITPEGAIVSESIAIAEELATRHPEAGRWPDDAAARATARTLVGEMHAGFSALRSDCPMNLRVAYRDVTPPPNVAADLRRLETLWAHARSMTDQSGPWLFGRYSAADAFFAPVAARIAGYGFQVSPEAATYVAAHLNDPAFRRWRAMGLVHGETLRWYQKDHAKTHWPGPAPIAARARDQGTPENATCPYSGKPVTHLLETQGRVFGFCNAFCRDKTVADPGAWPGFMRLLNRG